ncbi:capping protein inhibiting regulator of actin dynamics-like [Benincasa hispida]|uniref:capping protein inhibiting regulator of actin dynamics-like n=1 Tax=Benincasa hispida TaxID=102211 RepID=UPI0019000C74|nr:capping protein inhibiting regulator of actin dynamics-like [Benincasa hispida]
MEKEGGLLEARVVNRSLPSEEEMEEASRRITLAILDPKETTNAESYKGPTRVSLEEAATEKQPEVAEEKKKKMMIKEKRAEGDEEAHPIKKKERRTNEKKECRRKERRLKKEEERRKMAESPELDGESTSVKRDKGDSAQLKNERNLKHRKRLRLANENAPLGSTIDPPILIDVLEEQERRRKEEEKKQEKML